MHRHTNANALNRRLDDVRAAAPAVVVVVVVFVGSVVCSINNNIHFCSNTIVHTIYIHHTYGTTQPYMRIDSRRKGLFSQKRQSNRAS